MDKLSGLNDLDRYDLIEDFERMNPDCVYSTPNEINARRVAQKLDRKNTKREKREKRNRKNEKNHHRPNGVWKNISGH